MHDKRSLIFFTTNEHKVHAARQCLVPHGIELSSRRDTLHEIQAEDVELIARHKAAQAYARATRPIIVEDSGLFVDALSGFPGPYLKAVMTTVGTGGLLRLLDGKYDRNCTLTSVLVLQWSPTDTIAFTSSSSWRVRISEGAMVPGGWSDLWTLLEPTSSEDERSCEQHPWVFQQLANWLSGHAFAEPAASW